MVADEFFDAIHSKSLRRVLFCLFVCFVPIKRLYMEGEFKLYADFRMAYYIHEYRVLQ